MLGVRQREALDQFADILKRNPPGVVRIEVRILPFRYYSREAGGGKGHPITVTMYECYEGEPDAQFQKRWLASCVYESEAVKKGQEMARYLVAAGCDRRYIRLKQRN